MQLQDILIIVMVSCIGTVIANLAALRKKQKRQQEKEDRKHRDNMKWAESHRRTQ